MNKFNHIKKLIVSVGAVISMFTLPVLTSCDKTSVIGSDLVSDEVSVVVDSSFTLTANSVRVDAVLSRTTVQMLGVIDAPEYGIIRSDVVTQFMPANTFVTEGVTVNDIDSLKLVMLVNRGAFVGDSLAFLGMEVYPLTRQLTTPMYSNFIPDGYYDTSDMLGSTVYNLTKTAEPDSLQSNNYFTISVDLPVEMGRRFFTEYQNNPATFSSPTAFAKYFPGLYIKNSFGSGRITRVASTTMRMYYRQNVVNDKGNDTTYYQVGSYFAVTPEIITNNDITLDIAPEINRRVSEGQSILLAPAGLEVQIAFPGRELVQTYLKGTDGALGVVNTLSLELPVEKIENKYDISMPEDVLLVLKKDKDEFFIQNKLPDNATSFRATLSLLSDGTPAYVFSDMRQYIVNLLAQESITDDDVTFMLVPVTAVSETSSDYYGGTTSTLTAINPYVTEPKMANILTQKAKIKFVYTRQTTNF